MSEQKTVTMWTIVGANLITAAIVGAVAFATTIPARIEKEQTEGCSAMQSKAKAYLKTVYVFEEGYRADNDEYTDLVTLGLKDAPADVPYIFATESKSATAFEVSAKGTGDMHGDEWRITQNNDLVNKVNLCR